MRRVSFLRRESRRGHENALKRTSTVPNCPQNYRGGLPAARGRGGVARGCRGELARWVWGAQNFHKKAPTSQPGPLTQLVTMGVKILYHAASDAFLSRRVGIMDEEPPSGRFVPYLPARFILKHSETVPRRHCEQEARQACSAAILHRLIGLLDGVKLPAPCVRRRHVLLFRPTREVKHPQRSEGGQVRFLA